MKLVNLLGIILLVFLLAAILFPVSQGYPASPKTACLSNVKQQALGLAMYANDSNDRFPLRDGWMDGTSPYVRTERVFHDPEGPKGGYGYAFSAYLSSAKGAKLEDPARTTMLYDSVNPIRNASDLVASLPAHGRHPAKEPRTNTIGYADGHAKSKRMVP